ncbi:MAG: hypothetical protein WC936_07275 [Candidatus Nanoarchaeia archaeon]|jgi:hypothetical protein
MKYEDVSEFPEFINLDDMEEVERIEYLLNIIKRYDKVVKFAKDYLIKNELQRVKDNIVSGNFKISTKTNTSIDNSILFVSYPDIYSKLASEGKLVAKIDDLKELDLEGVVNTTKSEWLSSM